MTTDALITRDAHLLWHPFTQHGIEKTTIPISYAKDASLFTPDNFEIIDCIASWWTITHGHNNDILNHALYQQAQTLPHVMFAGFTHEPAVCLAEKLLKLTHYHFDKIFYADNGSSAVEVALKLAYQYHYNQGETDKKIFLAFDGGYHGDTFGAMATGQTTGFYDPFKPLLCQTIPVPYAYLQENIDLTIAFENEALAKFDALLEKHHTQIACMILEPLMQGAKGMRLCRPEFINQICYRLQSYNILIIFDEIATGFGRTGTMFAFEQCTVIPDLMCISKGLTGGYLPLSATLVTQKIYDAFLSNDYKKSFTHGHSFTANPLACAVANANIDLFTTNQTIKIIDNIHDTYCHVLNDMKKINTITNIRMLGSLLAWDLKNDSIDYKTKDSESLKEKLLQAGYNMRPLGKTFYLMPPYSICDLEHHLWKIFQFFK
jgi:adenosylmethionine-8-amino-7-oxononanoate aminotransferase